MPSWINLPDRAPQPASSAARLVLYSLGGAVAMVLPGWLHGARPNLTWSCLALSLAALGMTFNQRQQFLHCLLVMGMGLIIDFARISPLTMAALCGASGGVLAMMLEHLYLLPSTSVAMLLMVLSDQRTRPLRQALIRSVVNATLMLAATTLTMLLMQSLARLFGLNWGAEAWACAMAGGMAAYFAISLKQ